MLRGGELSWDEKSPGLSGHPRIRERLFIKGGLGTAFGVKTTFFRHSCRSRMGRSGVAFRNLNLREQSSYLNRQTSESLRLTVTPAFQERFRNLGWTVQLGKVLRDDEGGIT